MAIGSKKKTTKTKNMCGFSPRNILGYYHLNVKTHTDCANTRTLTMKHIRNRTYVCMIMREIIIAPQRVVKHIRSK